MNFEDTRTDAVGCSDPPAGLPREEVLLHIARAAEREGLGLCLWRHVSVAPPLAGSDVDAVIQPCSWAILKKFFERELRAVDWRAVRFVERGNMLICLFARRGARPGVADDFLKLDLNSALSLDGLPFAALSELLARSRVQDGVRRLDPVDAVVASYLVKRLDHGSPKSAYVEAYWAALESDPERVRQLVVGAIGARLSGRLLTRGARLGQPRARLARLRAALLHRPLETVEIYLRKIRDFVPTLVRPSGRMLVVCGPDGAGKSTMNSVLEKLVDETIFTHVRFFHTRPFLIPRLAKILPISAERRKELLAPAPRREVLLDPSLRVSEPTLLTSIVRMPILVVDFVLGYWVKVRPRLMRGELVIFDRYIQDYIVDADKRGFVFPPSVFRWLSRVLPKGDLYVYLVAKPETLVARKGELLPRQAAEQVDLYAGLAAEDPRGLLLNSEDSDPEELAVFLAKRLLSDRR